MTPAARGMRVVVLGDLVVDVVLAPATELQAGTDVPGRVLLRQGGSGATTARWLARSGVEVTLISAVGRDAAGRALIATIERDGVRPRIVRIPGRPTGRGATLELAPGNIRSEWFAGADLVHIPAYSLLGHPLGDAGRRAADLGHSTGALVTVDLASSGPLLAAGRAAFEAIGATRADLIFAAGIESTALGVSEEGLLELAPIVVRKRGALGARITFLHHGAVRTVDVPARPLETADSTGAGDAFDAGFILGWLGGRRLGYGAAASLRRAARSGHRLAARHLRAPRRELAFR